MSLYKKRGLVGLHNLGWSRLELVPGIQTISFQFSLSLSISWLYFLVLASFSSGPLSHLAAKTAPGSSRLIVSLVLTISEEALSEPISVTVLEKELGFGFDDKCIHS